MEIFGNVSGTYLGAIPERANLELIFNMVHTYRFDGKNCDGNRYNDPDGWLREANYDYTAIAPYGRLRRAKWQGTIDIERHDGENYTTYEILIEHTRGNTVNRCRIYVTMLLPAGECLEFSAHDCSDDYCLYDLPMNFNDFSYEQIAPLLAPASRPHFPYDSAIIRRRISLPGLEGRFQCRISRGRLQYATVRDAECNLVFMLDQIFVPHSETPRYYWATSSHSGTIGTGEFEADTLDDNPLPSPIDPVPERIWEIIHALSNRGIQR